MSIREIAQHLKVSTATVSLALKNDSRVRQTTKERVLAYCQAIGYVPSFNARNLSAGRSHTLHLVSEHSEKMGTGHFLTDFLVGASKVAFPRGYRITLSLLHELEWDQLKPHLRDGSADGFLLLNPKEAEPYSEFAEAGVPLLTVGRCSANWGWRVDSNNLSVGRDIGQHLKSQGYKRPLLLGPADRTFTTDRLRGLQTVYSKAILRDCSILSEAFETTLEALPQGFDSLLVTDDILLPGVLKGLKQLGYTAPEVGVVGMGNDLSPYLDPEVTSIDFSAQAIGEMAALRLLDICSQGNPMRKEESKPTYVDHRLIVRSSTQRIR